MDLPTFILIPDPFDKDGVIHLSLIVIIITVYCPSPGLANFKADLSLYIAEVNAVRQLVIKRVDFFQVTYRLHKFLTAGSQTGKGR